MIEPEARRTLDQAPAGQPVTLVLQWPGLPDGDRLAGLPSPEQRKSVMAEHVKRLKAPVLAWLRQHAEVQINDLTGTGSAVATAPASVWITLLAPPDSPLHHDEVRVRPNKRYFADGR